MKDTGKREQTRSCLCSPSWSILREAKFVIVCFVFSFLSLGVFSQEQSYGHEIRNNNKADILQHINVRQDSRIDSLLQCHIKQNQRRDGTEGYRIEIFFGSGSKGREEAGRKKTEFLRIFPDETAYMSFQSPDFKVRVGDCRTKSEALKLKERIRHYYPNSFIVPDIVQFPKLFSDDK